MNNPIFESKHCKLIESETPSGSLYYAIHYDYSDLTQEAFINLIELTLPDGSVIPLPASKYQHLYLTEEENLTKNLI